MGMGNLPILGLNKHLFIKSYGRNLFISQNTHVQYYHSGTAFLNLNMGNEASSQSQQYGKKINNNIVVKWVKSCNECTYAPREGQASAVLDGKLYVFGGVLLNTGNQDSESNELLVLDIETGKWSKEECVGTTPSPRSGSTMAAVGKHLYLFGGLSQFTGWMNDLFLYDTGKKEWKQLEVVNGPSPRDKLASAVFGDKIYLFGGFGPVTDEAETSSEDILTVDNDDDAEYDDIDELHEVRNVQDAANFTWSDMLFVFDTAIQEWSVLVQKDVANVPSARAAHTLTPVIDSSNQEWLYLFGGRDSESRQNDLWKYSVAENVWKLCKSSGCQPQPRSFHASAAVKGRLIIHGGRGISNQHLSDFNIFDTETNQWLQPEVTCIGESGELLPPPPAVGLHTLCAVNNNILLYGGTSNLDPATGTCTLFYNDVYKLKFEDVLNRGAVDVDEKKNIDIVHEPNIPSFLNLKQVNTADSASSSS